MLLDLVIDSGRIKIRPKQTQYVKVEENLLSVRFALDSQYLKALQDDDLLVNHSLIYQGPKSVPSLSCRKCKAVWFSPPPTPGASDEEVGGKDDER